MEVFIIVSLILAGLLLFIVEVFLIPGIRPKLHSHYRLVYALKNHGQAFFEENTGL